MQQQLLLTLLACCAVTVHSGGCFVIASGVCQVMHSSEQQLGSLWQTAAWVLLFLGSAAHLVLQMRPWNVLGKRRPVVHRIQWRRAAKRRLVRLNEPPILMFLQPSGSSWHFRACTAVASAHSLSRVRSSCPLATP